MVSEPLLKSFGVPLLSSLVFLGVICSRCCEQHRCLHRDFSTSKTIALPPQLGIATSRVRAEFLHTRTRLAGLDPRPRPGPIINRVFFLGPRPAPSGPAGPRAPFSLQPKLWPTKKNFLNEAQIHFCLPSPFRHCIYNKHKTQYTQFLPQYITVTP